MKGYTISDASREHSYVFDKIEDRDELLVEFKFLYPGITFYIGQIDQDSGKVNWVKPSFPT